MELVGAEQKYYELSILPNFQELWHHSQLPLQQDMTIIVNQLLYTNLNLYFSFKSSLQFQYSILYSPDYFIKFFITFTYRVCIKYDIVIFPLCFYCVKSRCFQNAFLIFHTVLTFSLEA